MKRTFVAVAVLVVAVLGGAMAQAAWLSSDGSGSAQATGASVGSGNAPTASASGSSVTVSWSASALATGYQVKRYTAVGDVLQTIGAGCSGTITLLTCTETGVAIGAWKYSVTPLRSNWTGAESAKTTVTVAAPDTTAPTATITFAANGGLYNATSFNAGCNPDPGNLCGTASDATGVATVRVSVLQASPSKYWNTATSAFDLNNETFFTATLSSANSTSTNWRLPITLSNDTNYTIHVQAVDTLGNAQTGTTYAASSTFTYDNTAPSLTNVDIKTTKNQTPPTVTVSGKSNDNTVSVSVVLCSANSFPCSAGNTLATLSASVVSGGNWSASTTSIAAGTTVYAKPTQTDAAGNTGTIANSVSVTVTA